MNYIHISPIRCAVTAALTLIAAALHGEVPAGYYAMLTGKSGAELKTALSGIIYPRAIEYDSSSLYSRRYSSLPDYFRYTDVKPLTSPQLWWDMYSNIPLRSSTFSGLNREHSFPKSWWGGSQVIPAYIDLNHLYPSEQAANLAKSNYPLGEVTGTPTFDNGVSLVGRGVNSGGAPYVFEPADEYKGDFARTYFYMVTAYQNLNWKYTYMVADGIYPTLQPWAQNLLIKWHKQDPVSEKELLRNEEVYRIQSNRNPFIVNKQIAYSGGGYFRLLPYWFVKNQMNSSAYNMCYFHIGDILTTKRKFMSKAEYEEYFKEPGTLKNRYLRYLKSNIGRGNALKNLDKLISEFQFKSISDCWEQIPQNKIIFL